MSSRIAYTIENNKVARFYKEIKIELRILTIAFIQVSRIIMALCLTNYYYAQLIKIEWIFSILGDIALL